MSVSISQSGSGSDEIKKEEIGEDGVTKDAGIRGGWGSKIEFFMAMLGSCVGLGSVWRFPYLCYSNGGGAFLLAYILMIGILGLPIFFLETSLGQFSNLGAISVWKLSPLFKGIGFAALITGFCITTYYSALIAQFMYYFILSMSDPLPWSKCFEWWGASPCCRECFANDTDCVPSRNVTDANCTKYNLPGEEFYNIYVLQLSPGIDQFGTPVTALALTLFASWIIATLVLLRGATSFGKVAYFTAIFPYIMLITMLIQGAIQPGAGDGVYYYLVPQWEKLLDPVVWSNAAGQVFYSLSTAFGQTIALASYNEFRHPLLRDGIIIVCMTLGTAILSGFVVFTYLGYMAYEKNVPLEEVVTAGPGLVFQVYPEALSTMPVATLWAILFFLMMLTLGFGTLFSQLETIQVAVQDELSHLLKSSRKKTIILRVSISIFMFLLALPLTCNGGMYLLNLVDQSSGTFGLLFIALAECLVIPWVYGWDRFSTDIAMMTGRRPVLYFIICWGVVLPVSLAVVLIMNLIFYQEPTYEGYVYPEWAIQLGLVMLVAPMVAVPLYMIYYHFWVSKAWILLREGAKPKFGWGPSRPEDYKDYMEALPKKHHFQTRESTAKAYVRAMMGADSEYLMESDTIKPPYHEEKHDFYFENSQL